jgi:hypothetical protein
MHLSTPVCNGTCRIVLFLQSDRNTVCEKSRIFPANTNFIQVEGNVSVLKRGCICPLQCVTEPAELFYFCNVTCLCPIFEDLVFEDYLLGCNAVWSDKRSPAVLRNLTASDMRPDE